jgi:hypothetical protein
MPCIRSRLASSLAGDLLADGALLLRGYSDFASQPGCDLQIDTRKPDGLVAFYRRAAAATSRIDFCIHCLGIERGTNAEEKRKNRLDARTIFRGTLLALRQLKRQQGSGTILNVALTESIESTDAAMILAARDLVVGVTHYAATVAPGKFEPLRSCRIRDHLGHSSVLDRISKFEKFVYPTQKSVDSATHCFSSLDSFCSAPKRLFPQMSQEMTILGQERPSRDAGNA